MLKRTLIRNATVITVDPQLGNLDQGDILIEGSKIAAVGTGLEAGGAEIIDGTGTIVMPGMVDTHRHVWQTTLRNIAADWTLDQYFAGVRGQLGEHFCADDMYTANLAGACEALNAGITTVLDWSHNMNTPAHTDGAVNGLRDSGGRFVMCYGNSNAEWLPVSNLPTSRDAYRVKQEYFSDAGSLVQMGMALRGPQYATESVTIDDWALARDIGALISVHVGDGAWGKNRPVAWLAEQGLLEGVVCVHCNSLADDEFRIMADHGAWASMTPDIELQMGHGWPATGRLMKEGLAPTLGVDIVTSNSGHLFQVMRTVLLVERAWAHHDADQAGTTVQRLPIDTSDVLAFATINGARALGMEHRIGSLTPGKDADICMLRADNLEMAPLNNPVGAVVLAGHPGLVDSVWVAGKAVKRHGKLVNVDVARLIGDLERSRDRVLALAGVAPGGRFIPAPYQAAH
jgi:cytosine/adenosine deaminase-related metal-dependent hydrolase